MRRSLVILRRSEVEQNHRTTEPSGTKPREAPEIGTSSVLGSSGKRLKVNAAQAVNIKKAGKRKMEEMGLNDKTVQRLREYLLAEGWTAEKILDLFDYLTK